MTRYGFAIKALPKGDKPFGDEEDDEKPEDTEEESIEDTDPSAALEDPSADMAGDPAAPPEGSVAEPPLEGTEALAEGEPQADAPEPPIDDARPWAGDVYDEGDEPDPDDAWSAYKGSSGEEAWLEASQDGTLTGWVRDSTGQVWRYTDPDAWAVDVDGAHMTNIHRRGEEAASTPEAAPPASRGVQESMFQ